MLKFVNRDKPLSKHDAVYDFSIKSDFSMVVFFRDILAETYHIKEQHLRDMFPTKRRLQKDKTHRLKTLRFHPHPLFILYSVFKASTVKLRHMFVFRLLVNSFYSRCVSSMRTAHTIDPLHVMTVILYALILVISPH